jgi:hypothetical protein
MKYTKKDISKLFQEKSGLKAGDRISVRYWGGNPYTVSDDFKISNSEGYVER